MTSIVKSIQLDIVNIVVFPGNGQLGHHSVQWRRTVIQVIVVAWFVRVYAAIMHEHERVHYRAYTFTNHATTDLSHLHASNVSTCQDI